MNQNIEFYNRNAAWYANDIVGLDISEQLKRFLELIPSNGRILDGGCGTGRDALAMINRGYSVAAFDGSVELAKIASNNTGLDVLVDTFEDIVLPENYFDGIWCMASLLHVSHNDMPFVFSKLYAAMKNGGYMYCCYKRRDADFEKDGRTFTCYNEQKLNKMLSKTEFTIIEIWANDDQRDSWINAILKK